MALLLVGTLGISTGFGMVLLLPLYVQELGGDEANFGVILASATVTAVVCIGTLIRYPDMLRPHTVVALAIVIYASGVLGAALVTESWTPLIGVGVLLGTAWAVVYTATPMVMSEMVTDDGRTTYFGYLTGTQQIGIGSGPVTAGLLIDAGIGLRGVFTIAGVICLFAAIATLLVGRLTPDSKRSQRNENDDPTVTIGFSAALRRIVGSEAIYSLVIIFLFACLFTSMTQFQATFASARGLDYAFFFVSYTVAVIFSRFVLAGFAGRFDTQLVIAVSVSVTAVATASFLLVGSSTVLYALAALCLGLGYGLALPTAQAQAVNVSGEAVRPRVLPMAGLFFQTAILAFPLVAGAVISGFGYEALFAVLVGLALIQVVIVWWRLWAKRRSGEISWG
jgi:MFS family permease